MYGIEDIDHLVSAVADVDHAGNLLAGIGFTVTPPSILGRIGAVNRLVMFAPQSPGVASFIETMAIIDHAKVPASLMEHFSGGSGYRWMVLSGPSAAATTVQLVKAGYRMNDPMPVERDWVLPSGEVLHVAFNVTLPIDAPIPFNFCEYRTLEHYLRPEFLRHANGAETLTAVMCQSEQPDECLDYFERLFGARRRLLSDGLHAVTPRHVDLIVGTAAAWGQILGRPSHGAGNSPHRIIGCRLKVREFAETADYLVRAECSLSRGTLGLVIGSPLKDETFFAFHA